MGKLLARYGWLAVSVVPPAIAVTFLRHAIIHHEILAAALALAYLIAVAVVQFIGGILRIVSNRWQERFADNVDRVLKRQVSRFERQYRDYVLAAARFIDLKDLSIVGHRAPQLNEVYVDVSLTYRAPQKVPADLLAGLPANVTERLSLTQFLHRNEPEILAVVGAPGSGKTTLLRHTARQICLTRPRRRLPILLYLRDHVEDIVSQPNVTLADLLRGTLGQWSVGEPPDWFEQRLRNGDCVVLLDGLDEVARPESRSTVANWVERQTRLFPRNDYIITSRPYGYQTARIDGATVLQVRDFTADQVTRFVRGWYESLARYAPEETDNIRRTRAAADDLLRRLNVAPALHDLTVNPLLLTMMVNVHREGGGKLPNSRVELYNEICQVVLWRRQTVKKLGTEVGGAKKEQVLSRLAYQMMQRREASLELHDVAAEIVSSLSQYSSGITAADFLADIGSSGLLIERGVGQYSFAHPTFREYLASVYVRNNNLVDVLAGSVDDAWWREATLLYSSVADANPIVQACLDSGRVSAITLAIYCADQGSTLQPALRERLEEIIDRASAPGAEPERRRQIAGALLARDLREQVRASDGAHVCIRPITATVYEIFLEDTGTPMPADLILLEEGDLALGMQAPDAIGFIDWVNTIFEGQAAYRLPDRAEVSDALVQQFLGPVMNHSPGRCVWISSDTSTGSHALEETDIWVPLGVLHPHIVRASDLTSQMQRDIKESLPTLARILLLRSLLTVHSSNNGADTARGLAQALVHCDEVDYALAVDVIRDRARSFIRATTRYRLDHVIDNANNREQARDVSLAFGGSPYSNRELNSDFYRALTLHSSQNIDDYANIPTALPKLKSIVEANLVLNRTLLPSFSHDIEGIAGKALSDSLTATLFQPRSTTDEWLVRFANAFMKLVNLPQKDQLIHFQGLESKFIEAANSLKEASSASDGESKFWIAEVTNRLYQKVLPIINRREAIRPEVAKGIRIAALCLAVEAGVLDLPEHAQTMHYIVASITLLEMRASGNAAMETILLSTE